LQKVNQQVDLIPCMKKEKQHCWFAHIRSSKPIVDQCFLLLEIWFVSLVQEG